jgi:DNA-binding Lrp family transcriptional regulator
MDSDKMKHIIRKDKGKYGYIEFVDIRKVLNDGWADQIEPEIRKPSPAEREEIILNFIRDNSGKSIKVSRIAKALAVTERTIQTHLKKLEEKKLIMRIKHCNKRNRQRANILEYIGPDTPRSKSDLTLDKLYDPDNPCGIRNWDWYEYKFILGYYTSKAERESIEAMFDDLKQKKFINAQKKEKLKKDDDE